MLINDLDAKVTYGFGLSDAPGWADAPPRQTPGAQVLRRGGVRVLDTPRDQARQITLRGTIKGTTVQDARDKADALRLAVYSPIGAKLSFDDFSTRYIMARCESFKIPPSGASMIQTKLTVEAVFTAHDPYSYDNDVAGPFIYYEPGDTIPGETFTRAATTNGASYNDINGVVQFAGTNVKRDAHYSGGVRHLLTEGPSSNFCLQAESLATAPWAVVGTPTITSGAHTASGISLDLIGDDDAGVLEGYSQVIAFTSTGNFKGFSVYVKQDTSASSVVRLNDSTAGADRLLGTLTWSAGLPVLAMTTGTYIGYETLAGGVFRLLFSSTTVTSANTNTFYVYPATTAALAAANTGTLYVGGVDWENVQTAPTSYIKTTTVTVTRAVDVYKITFPFAPRDMTIFVDYDDLAPILSGRVIAIGQTTVRLLLYHGGAATTHTTFHGNLAGGTVSIGAVGAALARTSYKEAARFYTNGSTDIQQSVNGAATTTSAPSAALSPWDATFTSPNMYIGSEAGASPGNHAYRKIVVMPAALTLAQMQTVDRMQLGTGPTRPLMTLTGVAVNPVFTLYNNVGVAVGTFGITVTMISTDVLVIDNDKKTITLNGVNRLDLPTTGDFFLIDPIDPQFQGVGPQIKVAGAAAAQLVISYRRSWR